MQNQPEEVVEDCEPYPYDDCVFINCPFDASYHPLFRALVFAIYDSGFIPRCVLEDPDSGEIRIRKLYRIISECQYGVHDISATELDAVNNLPRFNMPLELGLFLGALEYGSRPKYCLVLDREKYRYQKFISDLAGQDPAIHHGTTEGAIQCVRDWLHVKRPEPIPGGKEMFKRYQRFIADLPLYCSARHLEQASLTFTDLVTVVGEWLSHNEAWEQEEDVGR